MNAKSEFVAHVLKRAASISQVATLCPSSVAGIPSGSGEAPTRQPRPGLSPLAGSVCPAHSRRGAPG